MKQNSHTPVVIVIGNRLLRSGVVFSAYLVALAAMMAVGVYYSWFHERHRFQLSVDPAVWGQFGDFLGGVLNPIVAFMAFVWLARSYELQKIELAETRKALEKSEQAQQKQAEVTLQAARLDAITIRLNILSTKANLCTTFLKRLPNGPASLFGEVEYKGKSWPVDKARTAVFAELKEFEREEEELIHKMLRIENQLDSHDSAAD